MGGTSIVRFVAALLVSAALVAGVWILSLPNKAECVASGRTVDPTQRHCLSVGGFQQLEEHAAFHASEVAVGLSIVLAGGYVVYRYRRSTTQVA